MAGETWSLTSKACDACKTAAAAVFSRTDAAFLCAACIHAANKLASRHASIILCDVCEQAPASVRCKADAAALCASCDRDIHSVNALARRHERLPIVPFCDASVIRDEFSEEEAEVEAASWLLNDESSGQVEDESGSPEYESAEHLFSELDPCLDLDLISYEYEKKPNKINGVMNMKENNCSDGVVPVHIHRMNEFGTGQVDDLFPSCEVNYPGSKPSMYNFTSQSICPSVSSSSLEVGMVPDHNPMAEVANREARVLRYREKRKNRKFEKTIRYASRKAYAETRPRIKGRFAKRSELQVDSSYFVVPTF